MEVRVFYTLDGRPVEGNNLVPFTGLSFSTRWNEEGALGLSIRWHRLAALWRARVKLRPWLHSLAVIDEGRVLFAGPITSRCWEKLTLKVDAGDGWALWRKRLALNHALADAWVDGDVLIDEDNPAPEWMLSIAGQTLGGIGAALIRETLRWGEFLIDPPPPEPGIHVRNYPCWNGATVADRLHDLAGVQGAELMSFPAYIRDDDGHLRIRYTTGEAEVLHTWVQPAPGQKVSIVSVDEDGETLATDAYAFGGRDEDRLLVARAVSTTLTDAGWPLLQVADTSHSTVSQLTTLLGHAGQIVEDGSMLPESYQLTASAEHDVRPGHWIDLTVQDPYLGDRLVPLVVVEVARTTSRFQSIYAFPREFDLAETDE